MALTFDDLPKAGDWKDLSVARAVTEKLLSTLAKHSATAIGFVNERQLQVEGERDARINLLRRWLDAGMALGNHTYSHRDFQNTLLWQFEDEVVRGEAVTRQLLEERGQKLAYFRHPYNHTGPAREVRDEFAAFLKQRGYAVTPFTVEHSDYTFNNVYLRSLNGGDKPLAQRI